MFFFHSGFSVTSAEETRIFKPVSMQTMWWVKVKIPLCLGLYGLYCYYNGTQHITSWRTLLITTWPCSHFLTFLMSSNTHYLPFSPCYCKVSAAGVAWLLRAGSEGSGDPRQWLGVGQTLPAVYRVRSLLPQWVGNHGWPGVGPQGQWRTDVNKVPYFRNGVKHLRKWTLVAVTRQLVL